MPTLAELRNKAVKVKNASVSTLSNTKDRMSSQPGKNINWNAEIKPKPPPPPKPAFKPPPPPSRTSSAASSASNVSTQSKPTVPPVPVRRAGTSASSTLAKSPSVNPSPPPRPLPRSSNVYANTLAATPPPRPPPRSLNSTATSSPSPPPPAPGGLQPGPPPPIRRETRPDLVAPAPRAHVPVPPVRKLQEEVANVDRIDWANLSQEDKEAFFGWLDEFFSRYLGTSVGSCMGSPKAPVAGQAPPPIVRTTSRPTATSHQSRITAPEYITSYPPHPERGSLAEDLAHYFSPSTHWPSAWYGGDDILAPPLRGNGQLNWKGNWSSNGRSKTISVGVLFADLSMCFYTLTFPQPLPPSHDPNDARAVQRSARYLPRPQPWDQARLVDAHETYGETVAAFAESFAGTGQFCARGECWDLANEALKSFDQYDWVPKPVPSISRTHGHLIFEGRASDKGRTQVGRWRGGDDRVRRGDILEWRLAKVSRGPYASSTLGNPDHTAVIVSDAVPRTAVADGMSVPPRELGTLVVVEQGVTSPPKRESYDLAQFEEGEVWIYRPVSTEAYVGTFPVAQCPEGLNTLTV